MIAFFTDSAIPLLVAALVGLVLSAYGFGRWHGSPTYLPPEPVVEAEIVADVVAPVTATLVPVKDFSTLPDLFPAPDPLAAATAQTWLDERAEVTDQLVRAVRSKRTALRAAAVDRARVRRLLTDWVRPRKTPRAVLVAEVLEVGDRQVPLVPAAIAKQWEETE